MDNNNNPTDNKECMDNNNHSCNKACMGNNNLMDNRECMVVNNSKACMGKIICMVNLINNNKVFIHSILTLISNKINSNEINY